MGGVLTAGGGAGGFTPGIPGGASIPAAWSTSPTKDGKSSSFAAKLRLPLIGGGIGGGGGVAAFWYAIHDA